MLKIVYLLLLTTYHCLKKLGGDSYSHRCQDVNCGSAVDKEIYQRIPISNYIYEQIMYQPNDYFDVSDYLRYSKAERSMVDSSG